MTNDLVCCRIGSEQYALMRGDVHRVARADEVHFERAADGRVGVLAYGDEAVPVYRLAARLGRADHAASAEHHVVVTRGNGDPFGLLVDHTWRTRIADAGEIRSLPSILGPLATARFSGIVPIDDALLLVLSPAAIDPIGARYDTADDAETGADASVAAARASADLALLFSTDAIPRRERTRYAINARRVVALVQTLPSVIVPGALPFVAAIGWWRRTVVPILDFRSAAMRATAAAPTRYLVMRCGRSLGGALVAFPTGTDLTLHRATEDDREIAEGIYGIGREPVALLDLDRLITEAETPHGAGTRRI